MSDPNDTFLWRLSEQEKNLKELDDKFDRLHNEQSEIKAIVNANTNALEEIKGLVKWSLGGIISAIFTALGKLFLVGKV